MFHRAETVNHPYNLAQQSQFCGISTALQTDILGHVSSGCIGEYMLAGPGGQAGHIRGANLSMDKKGKAIKNMTFRWYGNKNRITTWDGWKKGTYYFKVTPADSKSYGLATFKYKQAK